MNVCNKLEFSSKVIPLQLILMLESEARTIISDALFQGMLLALPTNIRLGISTPAYCEN